MHTHSITTSLRLALAVAATLLPTTALAQDMPFGTSGISNVQGIRAQQEDGAVTVYWNPAEGVVDHYRVFYSHASILEQGGVYDDYEDAPGTTLQHTLTSVPPVATLYVSVLAVGPDGTESPFFVEEATVQLSPSRGATTSDTSVAPQEPSPISTIDSPVLRLLAAVSTSATGVTLSFTHSVSIPEQFTETAFTIKSGSGIPLPVMRFRIEGTQVILDTAVQMPGRVYQVQVHPSIAGKTTGDGLVPQEASMAPLLFTGLQTDASAADVQNLALVSKTGPNGTAVEATWNLPQGTFRELQVQQSTNGGRTFGAPVRLALSSKGITIPGVPMGTFTLLVRTVGSDGALSRGAQQTITIGGTSTSSTRSTATTSSVRSTSTSSKATMPQPGTLPQSGLGIGVLIALSGAATGMRFMRTKNR